MKKRVAINLIPFTSVQGTEIFTKNLVSNFTQDKEDFEFIILESEETPEILKFSNFKTITIKNLNFKFGKAIYQQTLIYFLLKKHKIDLLFSPSPAAPFFYKNKVVTIHDCAYDRFEEFENIISKTYFQLMYYGAKYFSKKIVTVSEFSKKELIDLYGFKPNKIKVIYEGVPEMPEVDNSFIKKILNKFKIKRPYFFYIGNRRPRKNLLGLLEGFKLFRGKFKIDYSLVIVSRKDKRFIDLEKEVKNRQLEKDVLLIDSESRKEKIALFKGSQALVFPSYYEGFGLPVLEAQSLGVPVITTNTSSLLEVGKDSVLWVDPYKAEEIAQKMKEIASDSELRENLIKKGFKNIQRFSWEKAAQELLVLFNSL
jgi:glycosyltransferase involved in cell wall biosynthesis